MSEQQKRTIDLSRLSIGLTEKDLCTRCGTCSGACPTEAISFTEDFYPTLLSDRCIECGLCKETCPGAEVNYSDLTKITFGHRNDPDTFDGVVNQTFVGYSNEDAFRNGGAGGGIITGLLWDMLKHGDVDGCLVTRMNANQPWLGEYFIARSFEDLQQSQGSRYMIIPLNQGLNDIRKLPGKYAVAALPCQIHGLRFLLEKDPILKKKIYAIVGLFCGGSLEPFVVTEMLESKGIDKNKISDFQFRGGEWPGKMRAIMKSGEIIDMHYSNYKDGAYNYFTHLYSPKRCQTCLDGSGQFSDISVSDAWTRNKSGEYRFKAHSRMLVRTSRGSDILKKAAERESITVQDVTADPDYTTHKMQTKRKRINAPYSYRQTIKQGKGGADIRPADA